MRRFLAVLLILVLLAGGGSAWLYGQYDVPGPLPAEANLVVPRGGLDVLAASLAQQGVITRPRLFQIAALLTRGDGPLHAGELPFPARASLRQVLAVLRTAKPVEHRLTIPEGLTAAQVAMLLEKVDAATGSAAIPAEGSILPETYSYERGASREQLLDRARTAMAHTLAHLWATRTPGLPLANPQEALALASIVERETAKPEERPLIAAVFLNRLRLGMKLQSDPTVIYGASGGLGVLDHPLTRVELDHDDPYNTYRIPGLPPGPICMPGVASLRAVLQPAQTNALYFVADGTGGHVFSATEQEHLRHVAQWREIERERGQAPAPVQP